MESTVGVDKSFYKQRLVSLLEQLEKDLTQTDASAETVVLDQSSVGRLSRMDAMQQQAMAQGLRARLETRKRQVLAALARIEDGRFGYCCQCDVELDERRLQHDPAVVFCADCLVEREASEG